MVKTVRQISFLAGTLAALSLTLSCDGTTGPDDTASLGFTPSALDLGETRQTQVTLENSGRRAVGPVQLVAGAATRNGEPAPEARLGVSPSEIPTLNPGTSVQIELTLGFDSPAQPGDYQVSLQARLGAEVIGTLGIRFSVTSPPIGGGTTVAITAGPAAPRQGDVVSYSAEVRDSTGAVVPGASLAWAVQPGSSGLAAADGRFVGYEPGAAQIIVSVGGAADTLAIQIVARGLSGSFSVVGRGQVTARFTSDLWVHGDYAYTGTWSVRNGEAGNRLYTWDVSTPSTPILMDSLMLAATTVNDVKIRADGTLGVSTHEGSPPNGITLFDLTDPAHPQAITRFTSELESGVHNVWIEGDFVYVAVDGPVGLRIVDISNPSSPVIAARFYAGSSFLHDIYVRDGLAFLSHWDAGLIILDVGNGVANGSPANPVEVSRIQTAGGNVHNAWFWPAADYVFVGEEDFSAPGVMHVVDVSDLSNPTEVGTFAVPGTTPHNFWVDEARGILYAAWYENGLRALDVSGELMGTIDLQGREITSIQYGSGSGCGGGSATCTWAPQLHRGLVYLSDLNSGLWVLQPGF